MGRILNKTVDEAAIDGRTTLVPRLFVAVLAALVLQASLTPNVILPWLLVLAASEILTRFGTRNISTTSPHISRQRLLFVFHVALSTSLWSLVCVWLWFSSQPGLRAVAAVIICAQLIHAQTYAYRSRTVSSISSGIPALVITVLTLGYAGLSGLDLITAIAGLGLTFGYVEAGTRANIANARQIAIAQLELERLAYTDALTALANRRRFSVRLNELIEYSRRHRTPFALVLVDLDNFKAVNDELGHDIGDEVLAAVAASLCDAVCEPDHVARLGGDEFALLVSDVADDTYMANLFRKIEAALSANQTLAGHRRQTTLSIGAATYPCDGEVAGELLRAADLALYEAKSAGRNTWRAYRHCFAGRSTAQLPSLFSRGKTSRARSGSPNHGRSAPGLADAAAFTRTTRIEPGAAIAAISAIAHPAELPHFRDLRSVSQSAPAEPPEPPSSQPTAEQRMA